MYSGAIKHVRSEHKLGTTKTSREEDRRKEEWVQHAQQVRQGILEEGSQEVPDTGGASSSAGATRPVAHSGIFSFEEAKQL